MANKGLAANRRKRRARKNPSTATRANPPVGTDLTHVVLPGFAAYAASRFFSRIVYSIVQRRWPRFGKHAGVLASLGAFGGSWFAAHRFKRLAPYHDGILVGTGIAALSTVARTYLPGKYAYIVSDYHPGQVATQRQLAPAQVQAQAELPVAPAGDEFSYLEAEIDAMGPPPDIVPSAPSAADLMADVSDDMDPDLMDLMDDDGDMDFGGSFAENSLN